MAEVGLQHDDVLTLATRRIAVAATISSFAAIMPDGSVAARLL